MTTDQERDWFLGILGVGVLLWLVFRHRGSNAPTQTVVSGGVPLSLPSVDAVPPDYLSYNVPAAGKLSLPSVSPISWSPSGVSSQPVGNIALSLLPGSSGNGGGAAFSSSPTCGCSDSQQQLFGSLGDLINYYFGQGNGFLQNYAANILSAFPHTSATAAGGGGIQSAGGAGGPLVVGSISGVGGAAYTIPPGKITGNPVMDGSVYF